MTAKTLPPVAPLDLAAERALLGTEVEAAVLAVLRSGQYVLGPEVAAFESEFASLSGVAHGVGVASGTDALILALRAAGVGPGDEVVTSPFTFFASAGAIAWLGARPVLADIEPETALLDPATAAAAVTPATRCILPVHLYGQMADMRALRALADDRGLTLVEDAAQAHGATRDGVSVGELGDSACFSFYPTKNLGAPGEGGLVVTRAGEVAAHLRRLRDHGSTEKYVHGEVGTNSRLQAVQAAALRVKLPYLAAWNTRRREIAARYDAAFADVEALTPLACVAGAGHVYHQYALRLRADHVRAKVVDELRERGVIAAIHYPRPVHTQPAAAEWGYREGDFPVAEALAREVICLPVHPFLADGDVERVAEALIELV